MADKRKDLFWHEHSISVGDRWESNGHKSCVLWFTGLSAAGKSTIANCLSARLHAMSINNYVLDGDNIRHGLNKDLGFSHSERKENIRRIGEVAKLFIDAGLIVMAAFISPYREDRERVRNLIPDDQFIEIYVKCSIAECELRDPKCIYKKARSGEIKEFTGISAPYEEPQSPEILLETDKLSLEECMDKVLCYLVERGCIIGQVMKDMHAS